MRLSLSLTTAALLLLAASLTPAHAQMAPKPATGAEITAAISGNSVSGAMAEAGSEYAEFYQADGVIIGAEYQGKWAVEGDQMCFTYDASPKTCYGVAISGDKVEWLGSGQVVGTGTIAKGNTVKK